MYYTIDIISYKRIAGDFMQYKQTPPIQYIPVFEAAARHLSFKKAAAELCVTAPAVGQQIKAFEHWLGKPLFKRQTRQLTLTAEGLYYFQAAKVLMKEHHAAYAEYTRCFDRSSLLISATLFVAQELVMPNYLSFNDFSPGTELRVEARMSHVDFDAEPIDAAIRFGDGNWPGLECRLLDTATVSPVCSPSYAEDNALSEISKLYKHRLIYAQPSIINWGTYFWKKGITHPKDTIMCDSYLAALKAASDGLGVTLAILPSANGWINDGRLILPYPIQVDIKKGYWLVYPKTEKTKPELEALFTWLKQIFTAVPSLEMPLKTLDLNF
ncbi:MAG: LysR family glycine cleavage system transcriptional activator [Oleiphilaceae bacterium]|jgi:LysR family glycine cleavage system transcriptional activator